MVRRIGCTVRGGAARKVLLLYLFAWSLFATIGLLAAAPRAARAGDGAIHPELQHLAARAGAAKGPETHAALRALFALWDKGDPRQVEQALLAASTDKTRSAPAQAYAQLILAEARVRRGDGPGAAQRMAELGFVDRWLFVGPFDDENRVGFGSPYQPETELLAPIVPGRAYDGKQRPVRWRSTTEGGAVFDFGDWVRPREQMCGYATTVVRAKPGTKPREISLWVGAEGSFKLWWNGKSVLEDPAYRGFDFDRFAATVDLAVGANRLTVKVCNDIAAPKIAVRIADASGVADRAIVVDNDPSATETVPATPRRSDRAAKRLEGPVQTFERLTAGTKPNARDMEAYARYLFLTGGSPRGEHRSRDLAARAAEAEPTWERAILAADLAEDRNQARSWVEQADKLVKAADGSAPGQGQPRSNRDQLARRDALLRSDPGHRSRPRAGAARPRGAVRAGRTAADRARRDRASARPPAVQRLALAHARSAFAFARAQR